MKYVRMPIEIESPEQMGYSSIKYNLTESSVHDAVLDDLAIDLKGLVLCYGDHKGLPELRELIASEHEGIDKEDVLITAGAATALFIVNTSLLETNSNLYVQFPNYGTNLETPKALGANIHAIPLLFENGFKANLSELQASVHHDSLLSITNPHNPSGVCLTEKELSAYVALAENKNSYLLVDETYRDLQNSPLPLAATLNEKVISVGSVSKAYGLPGLRIGWIISKNKLVMEKFLAAKEQIQICNSLIDETIAYQFLKNKKQMVASINEKVNRHRKIVFDFLAKEKRLECVMPEGGVVCYPRIIGLNATQTEQFYKELNEKLGTYVGPGHWFGMEKTYFRLGYGWPTSEDLFEGLKNISIALSKFI